MHQLVLFPTRNVEIEEWLISEFQQNLFILGKRENKKENKKKKNLSWFSTGSYSLDIAGKTEEVRDTSWAHIVRPNSLKGWGFNSDTWLTIISQLRLAFQWERSIDFSFLRGRIKQQLTKPRKRKKKKIIKERKAQNSQDIRKTR